MISELENNSALCSELKSLFINGSSIKSLMIIFRTNGCSYARKTGGCTHCSLSDNSLQNITSDNLITQFENEVKKYKSSDYQHIELLTLGSFLDESEVPKKVAEYILTYIGNNTCAQSILIESRPEFITEDKLYECITCLKEVKLEIGIGIESTNNYVRDVLLKKGYNMEDVNDSLKIMSKFNVGFLGYVLQKPVGLSEKEGIVDSIESVKCIFKLGKDYNLRTRIALQPYYIPRNSYSFQAYINGHYKTPMFWSIIEVLKHTNHLGNISVALNDEGLTDGLVTSNCSKCNSIIVREIEKYNYTNKMDELLKVECTCKEQWLYWV